VVSNIVEALRITVRRSNSTYLKSLVYSKKFGSMENVNVNIG
jgi:hypothetical protein